MPIDEIKKVFFVGVGTMGCFNSMVTAIAGYDVCEASGELDASNKERALKAVAFLKPFIDRGDLGMKTGRGFYTYPNALWQQPEFLKSK